MLADSGQCEVVSHLNRYPKSLSSNSRPMGHLNGRGRRFAMSSLQHASTIVSWSEPFLPLIS